MTIGELTVRNLHRSSQITTVAVILALRILIKIVLAGILVYFLVSYWRCSRKGERSLKSFLHFVLEKFNIQRH